MSFIKKTWTDRLVEFPGRRKLTNVTSNTSAVYDVERAEGVVSQNGSAFSAENMNDLETRIEAAINSEETNNESTYVKKAGDTLTGPLKWLLNKGEVFFDKIASSETWHLVYKKNKASSWSKTIMTVTPTSDGNSATATFDGDATSAGTARKLGETTVGSAARGMYLNLGAPTPLNPLTSNRALVSDANGNVAASAVTSIELGYLDGVTKNVQNQLNNISLIVDGNGKLVFRNAAGADSVLPFSSVPKYIATAQMTYANAPSQRHYLQITQSMASYRTLVLFVVIYGITDISITAGPGSITSKQTYVFGDTVHMAAIIIQGATTATRLDITHAGTGQGIAMALGI